MTAPRPPMSRAKLLYGGLLAFELVILAVGGLVLGRQAWIAAGELQAQRAELARDRADAERLPELRAEAEQVAEDLALLEPTGPRALYVASLVEQLGEAAGQHGLTLAATAPQQGLGEQPPAAPPAGQWRVRATVAGGYAGLLELVEALQRAPKALAIEAVRLRTSGDAGRGRMAAELVLRGFELPPVPAPPQPPAEPADEGEVGPSPGPFGPPDPGQLEPPPAVDQPTPAEPAPSFGDEPAPSGPRPGAPSPGAPSPAPPAGGTDEPGQGVFDVYGSPAANRDGAGVVPSAPRTQG